MTITAKLKKVSFGTIISLIIPLLLFWIILMFRIPYSVTFHFSNYSFGFFVIVFLIYYAFLHLKGNLGLLAAFGLTMALLASALSYKWTSGFSDNFLIGGLLPYKDAKNYYLGASLILQGLPIEKAVQAVERPLFPGFLASILMITSQNLKIAVAIIVQFVGIGLYLSARQIHNSMGALSAGLYSTFMYFYIQPLIGYTLSELLGFMLGCFAFLLIWHVSHDLKWFNFILGLMTLLMAVSARAGAFFIFPMLMIWAGWIFRGENRFSMKAAALTFVIILVGYFFMNTIYPQLLGIPSGSAFGNFSYALYGQVRGGTGWHSAIEELGTRNPDLVYRAAFQFFLEHPISLLIGFAKSYRDFFLPGGPSIFPFRFHSWQDWPGFVLWMGAMVLLIRGTIQLLKNIRSNPVSMLVSGFIGVILSIPFLPPIDGGSRFYASTMPFFFIIPAVGLSRLGKERLQNFTSTDELFISRPLFIILITLTLIVPIGIYFLRQKPTYTMPSCTTGQTPFALEIQQGSYINLVREASECGLVPEVCLSDFEKNNTEKAMDDYYQKLLLLTKGKDTDVRIIPAVDLINQEFHYFFISHGNISDNPLPQLVTGCAVEIMTENQSIYQVESIFPIK
ncbi:MAG: hypothetical protein L0Z71_02465 [Anaerolineae bacterium]|nr:hypothetical protein [Anaerolineae bacterium]